MLDEKQTGFLRDILDPALIIRRYMNQVSHGEFLANTEKQDAVLRRFEIIGEAANRLDQEAQSTFPSLPFRAMRGMRNIIAHDYGDVDIEQVWTTAIGNLDHLIETLSQYFERT